MSKNVNFDIIIFGSNQKGKLKVFSTYEKDQQLWTLQKIQVLTNKERVEII